MNQLENKIYLKLQIYIQSKCTWRLFQISLTIQKTQNSIIRYYYMCLAKGKNTFLRDEKGTDRGCSIYNIYVYRYTYVHVRN